MTVARNVNDSGDSKTSQTAGAQPEDLIQLKLKLAACEELLRQATHNRMEAAGIVNRIAVYAKVYAEGKSDLEEILPEDDSVLADSRVTKQETREKNAQNLAQAKADFKMLEDCEISCQEQVKILQAKILAATPVDKQELEKLESQFTLLNREFQSVQTDRLKAQSAVAQITAMRNAYAKSTEAKSLLEKMYGPDDDAVKKAKARQEQTKRDNDQHVVVGEANLMALQVREGELSKLVQDLREKILRAKHGTPAPSSAAANTNTSALGMFGSVPANAAVPANTTAPVVPSANLSLSASVQP